MENKKKNVVGAVLIFILLGVFILFRDIDRNEKNKLLEKSEETIAIILKKGGGSVNSPYNGKFKYFIDGQKYEFTQSGNFEFMNLGDTVLIEYAIEDHSVARVKDKFYMKKYLYLKK